MSFPRTSSHPKRSRASPPAASAVGYGGRELGSAGATAIAGAGAGGGAGAKTCLLTGEAPQTLFEAPLPGGIFQTGTADFLDDAATEETLFRIHEILEDQAP